MASREDTRRFANLVLLTRRQYPRDTEAQMFERVQQIDPALYAAATNAPPPPAASEALGAPRRLPPPTPSALAAARKQVEKDLAAGLAANRAATKAELQQRLDVLHAQMKKRWDEDEVLLQAAAVQPDVDDARPVEGTRYVIRVPSTREELMGNYEDCYSPLSRDEAVLRLRVAADMKPEVFVAEQHRS